MRPIPLARHTRPVLAGALAALTLGGCPARTYPPTQMAAPRGTLSAVGLGIEPDSWWSTWASTA